MPEEVEELQAPDITEALKPLFDNRDELLDREAELLEKLETIKEARKRIEKILRAGGLLEIPERKARSNGAGHHNLPSENMIAIIRESVETFKVGDEFTIRTISEASGKDLATVKRCLEALREQKIVRLAGKKPVPGSSNSGTKALFYARVA